MRATVTGCVVMLAVVLASGCELPVPEGVPLANVREAAAVALEAWGQPADRQPVIWGVHSNCSITRPDGKTGHGFIDPASKLCKGGFSDPRGGDIYMVLHPGIGYYHGGVMPHELAHHVFRDEHHKRADIWGPGGKVDVARMALMVRPDVNRVEIAE